MPFYAIRMIDILQKIILGELLRFPMMDCDLVPTRPFNLENYIPKAKHDMKIDDLDSTPGIFGNFNPLLFIFSE